MMMWFTYRAWLADYPPAVVTAPTEQAAGTAPELPLELPQLDSPAESLPALTESDAPVETPPLEAAAPERVIRVRTDVLEIMIDTQGGDLVRADLPAYPVDKDTPDLPVRLLDFLPESRWVFQTGFLGVATGDAPNHLAAFTSPRSDYVLADGDDELIVTLDWQTSGPLRAQKIYTFRRGQYGVELNLVIENQSAEPWSGAPYAQLSRHHIPVSRSYTSVDSYSFTGPVLYDGDEYEKLDVEDLILEPIDQTLSGGWLASIQHHFLAAAVPPAEDVVTYKAITRGSDYQLTALSQVRAVAPGDSLTYPVQLFVGPKLQDQLAATGNELELTVDYGVLTILAQPLFWLLSKVHGFVNNWGLSIILVTLLIKLAFYKLTQASGRSMAKMRKLQPRMKAMQERFKDDRHGAESGDDGALQARKGQSGGGVFADSDPDAVFLRVLLGVDRERGNQASAVHALDYRPVVARSFLRAAAAYGCCDVNADSAESGAARSRSSQDYADHARGLHRTVRVFPGWARALLANEYGLCRSFNNGE